MRTLKNYTISWIVLVGLFNLCCFITPNEWYGVSKYSGSFWVGYGFVMASFVFHFIYAFFAFSERNREKQVINTPITIFSFFELGLMVVVGLLCMAIPSLPYWLGIVLCYIVLALSVLFLISAKVVGENAVYANTALNTKTAFMRELTDKAQGLISSAKTAQAKEIATKIYEAIRYSDTISSEATKEDELAISERLSGLEGSINDIGIEGLQNKADEIFQLIEKRNNICKASKRQK